MGEPSLLLGGLDAAEISIVSRASKAAGASLRVPEDAGIPYARGVELARRGEILSLALSLATSQAIEGGNAEARLEAVVAMLRETYRAMVLREVEPRGAT